MTIIDVDHGTDESLWRDWPAMSTLPTQDLSDWADRRIVVLAAHPDDEVLALGGTLALLAQRGASLTLIWASQGEASHPGSVAAAIPDLPVLRMRETRAALRHLGVSGDAVTLGLPDGGLTGRYADLVRAARAIHRPGDLWFAPFRGDGHPDHEACGRAAAEVAADLVELPIWAWHWATPDDRTLPWERARAVVLPADVRASKDAAIAEFRTQVNAIGPAGEDGPVLPERVLAHFRRDVEVVFS